MEMKIETLTWEQVNAVWRSDEFCMLTDRQLAALHERFEQLKLCRAWENVQRVARVNRQLQELDLEQKRLRLTKGMKWLLLVAAGVFIGGYVLPSLLLAVGSLMALLGYMFVFSMVTMFTLTACFYGIKAYLWAWGRFCRS